MNNNDTITIFVDDDDENKLELNLRISRIILYQQKRLIYLI